MQLYEAILQLGKWDRIPITSTLLSTIYLSSSALTLTVGAARYKWSGISSLWACLSDVTGSFCDFQGCLYWKILSHVQPLWILMYCQEVHGFPLQALQFLDCRTEDATRRPTFSDLHKVAGNLPIAMGYKMFILKSSESRKDSSLTFCSS